MTYITNIFRTGAVRKTPPRIIKRIAAEADKAPCKNIVEIGAGKGEITAVVLQQHVPVSSYYAFEIDPNFARQLQQFLPPDHICIQDAFHFEQSLPAGFTPCCFISSMPLSFYSRPQIAGLLEKMKNRLQPGGRILLLFHAFWLIPILKKNLPGARIHSFATLPLYFLLVYEHTE